MLEALKKQYEAEVAIGMANLKVYMTSPAGIGEHSDIAEARGYLEEAGMRIQVAGTYMNKSQAVFGSSRDYYQRAIQELSAISGAVTAPPQQQESQRQEQGATS